MREYLHIITSFSMLSNDRWRASILSTSSHNSSLAGMHALVDMYGAELRVSRVRLII